MPNLHLAERKLEAHFNSVNNFDLNGDGRTDANEEHVARALDNTGDGQINAADFAPSEVADAEAYSRAVEKLLNSGRQSASQVGRRLTRRNGNHLERALAAFNLVQGLVDDANGLRIPDQTAQRDSALNNLLESMQVDTRSQSYDSDNFHQMEALFAAALVSLTDSRYAAENAARWGVVARSAKDVWR